MQHKSNTVTCKYFFVYIYKGLHTQWGGNHSTTEQGMILREKMCGKYGIKFFHVTLRF